MTEPPVNTTMDEVHAHAHKTGHGKLDLVIALAAIFISAVSLVVAIEHGRTERDLVAANSWPFIARILDVGYNGTQDIAIGIENDGVGPAKIQSVEVFVDGKPVSTGIDLLRKCCGYRDETPRQTQLPKGLYTSIADQTVLRAGNQNTMVKLFHTPDTPQIGDRLARAVNRLRISFKACYCSVLDQCWTSDLASTRTEPVKECTPPQHPFNPIGK